MARRRLNENAWIDTKEFDAALKALEKDTQNGNRNRHLRAYRKWLKKDMDRRFDVGGISEDDREGTWPALAKRANATGKLSLVRPRRFWNKPILENTGALRKAMKIQVKDKGWTIVQTNNVKNAKGYRYAWVHQFGANKSVTSKDGEVTHYSVPKREMILWTDSEIEELKASLIKWFVKTFEQKN